jgi:hypothetical protein
VKTGLKGSGFRKFTRAGAIVFAILETSDRGPNTPAFDMLPSLSPEPRILVSFLL